MTGVRQEMEASLRKVLRLRPGEDLAEGLRDALKEVPPGGYEALAERLEVLETDLPRASNSPGDDEVWAAVEGLVDAKVGPRYQDEEMREAEEEAERRRSAKIPPGFKDEGPGDYVLWRQTIDEAKRSGRPFVLVTDDRKEDWWWIEHGETIGPQFALVTEMRKEAGVPFYMYTPDRLMVEARERLNVEVSDESINEAEGLGRETDDDATGEARESTPLMNEMIDISTSLTDSEKRALRAFRVLEGSTGSVAEELGISHGAARRLVWGALDKLRSEIRESDAYSIWSEPERKNVRRFVGRRDSTLGHAKTLVKALSVMVQGDDHSIANFTRTLLNISPEIEEIDRRPADNPLGDAILELRFRTPVPVERAIIALEETARETGVDLSTLTYSHFEP